MEDIKKELLEIALTYSSPEEFKAKNLHKYTLAVRHRVLNIAFPIKRKENPKYGIVKYYMRNILVYISGSYTPLEDIKDFVNTKGLVFNNCKLYYPQNDSDGHVLLSYLINLAKPRYNTGFGKSKLEITIPNILTRLGKYKHFKKKDINELINNYNSAISFHNDNVVSNRS